jgi:hypothetical protein
MAELTSSPFSRTPQIPRLASSLDMARLAHAAGPVGPWFGRLCVIERLLGPEPVSRATVSLIAGPASTDIGRFPSHPGFVQVLHPYQSSESLGQVEREL